ncbi:MAG: putative O-glycosylation ligase, exosortase A system-associated [Spiribacter salinus]|uniref:Putative O-glycosylation ligase, exosortase A system-associated n=1 Tax=Spiribacter salinus TaxID=1335746 RepID=A0A540VPL7_9GAMM|nr:MAG: putative O-glycosylation ligase, exosortase A system-associated [Spiribacter salinus]
MGLRDILVLFIVAGGAMLALGRPWIGVLTWNWISFMNPHRLAWNIQNLPVAQIVGVTTLLGLLFTRERRLPPLRAETVLLALLGAYFVLTTALAWDPVGSMYLLERTLKILLFIFVTMMLIYGWTKVRLLMLVTVASLGFYGAKGGIFAITTGGQYRVWGPPGSFITDNTALGLALCMVLPMTLFAARAEPKVWLRRALYAVFWLTIPAILFTYSRGALLGLIAVLLVIGWRYKIYGFILIVATAALLLLGQDLLPEHWVARQETTLNYEEDHSAMQRIQAWGVAFNVALERPLLGAGFDLAGASPDRWVSYANFLGEWNNIPRVSHSIFFQVLGQHGFLALGLFLTLIAVTIWRLGRTARTCTEGSVRWIGLYARGVQIALVPYCIAGAFLDLAYFDLFYTCVAFSVILDKERETSLASLRLGQQSGKEALP